MNWQDHVFLYGNIVFFVALLPAVFGRQKPPLSTSILTASVLSIYAFTFMTLGLTKSALGSVLTASTWWTLAVQAWVPRLVKP